MIRSRFVMAAVLATASAPLVAQTPPAQTAPASPEALAAARRVAARLLPPGIYRTIMASTMDTMSSNMGAALKAMPLRQLAQMGGMTPEEAKKLDQVDVAALMAIYDPHWEERQRLSMGAMFAAMGDFFTTMEPDLREGTAQAYAHRFTAAELTDLDRYFATPTGAKFAANATTIMTDPAVMERMKTLMPRMMAQMPTFVAAAQKATAKLPPPRKLKDLSEDEKARLAKALGVPETKLRDPASIT